MRSRDDLAAAQRAFAAALAAFDRDPAAAFWDYFAEAPATAAHRFAAYRRNVAGNWRAALASTYPVVAALVGASAFRALADAFVAVEPSADGDLNAYGGIWPDFLQDQPVARALPYLQAVARLEWALLRACGATGAERFDLGALAAVPAVRHGELRLVVWPGATLVASDYPIVAIWQAHQLADAARDAALASPPDDGQRALAVRDDAGLVFPIAVSPGEAAFLCACRAGTTLGEAIAAALAAEAGFDPAAALQRLVAAGALTGFTLEPSGELS